MARIARATGWMLGVATLACFLCVSDNAQAGTTRIGGGGITKVGDPFYVYSFDVFLLKSSIYTLEKGDSFTIHDVPAVDATSLTGQPSGSPTGPWAPSINFTKNDDYPNHAPPYSVPFSDVTWSNFGAPIPADPNNEVFLGTFKVQTWQSLPFFLPDGYILSLTWSSIVHDNLGNRVEDSGVVDLVYRAIPEPTSLALLGMGVGIPALVLRRRRRSA